MPPRPSHLQTLLRILRHMLLVLCGALGAKAEVLRARCDRLPAGHRRRAGMEKELRRIAWAQAMLCDPDLLDDPAFRGMAAERARVRADAGRRAKVRRYIYPTPLERLRGAAPAAKSRPEEGRCTGFSVVALALPGVASRAAAWTHVRGAALGRPMRMRVWGVGPQRGSGRRPALLHPLRNPSALTGAGARRKETPGLVGRFGRFRA